MPGGSNQKMTVGGPDPVRMLGRNVDDMPRAHRNVAAVDMDKPSPFDDVENVIAFMLVHRKGRARAQPNKIAPEVRTIWFLAAYTVTAVNPRERMVGWIN